MSADFRQGGKLIPGDPAQAGAGATENTRPPYKFAIAMQNYNGVDQLVLHNALPWSRRTCLGQTRRDSATIRSS